MAFKFDALDTDVQKFRAIVQKARKLDEDIDSNLLTPDEAAYALEEFISKNGVPAPSAKVKKLQDDAKKAAAIEKAAADKAAKAEAVA